MGGNMLNITITETTEKDLKAIQELWADGNVMQYVGFPQGLIKTDGQMNEWYERLRKSRPTSNHYSIFENDVYCGETFYSIDKTYRSASLDIKLFKFARGKGIAAQALLFAIQQAFEHGADKVWVDPNPENAKAIALYEKLGFRQGQMPSYLIGEDETASVYMELLREQI